MTQYTKLKTGRLWLAIIICLLLVGLNNTMGQGYIGFAPPEPLDPPKLALDYVKGHVFEDMLNPIWKMGNKSSYYLTFQETNNAEHPHWPDQLVIFDSTGRHIETIIKRSFGKATEQELQTAALKKVSDYMVAEKHYFDATSMLFKVLCSGGCYKVKKVASVAEPVTLAHVTTVKTDKIVMHNEAILVRSLEGSWYFSLLGDFQRFDAKLLTKPEFLVH